MAEISYKRQRDAIVIYYYFRCARKIDMSFIFCLNIVQRGDRKTEKYRLSIDSWMVGILYLFKWYLQN